MLAIGEILIVQLEAIILHANVLLTKLIQIVLDFCHGVAGVAGSQFRVLGQKDWEWLTAIGAANLDQRFNALLWTFANAIVLEAGLQFLFAPLHPLPPVGNRGWQKAEPAEFIHPLTPGLVALE